MKNVEKEKRSLINRTLSIEDTTREVSAEDEAQVLANDSMPLSAVTSHVTWYKTL